VRVRRTRWVLIGLAVGALVAAGWWLLRQALPEPLDPTWERIQETGILLVCTDPSWPPFEFVDTATGQLDGFDVQLAALLAQRLAPGVRSQIVTVGFDGLYDALQASRCDVVISALPYEPLRTQEVAYSVAYFNAGLVVLAQEGTEEIATPDDLAGHVVGVEWGFVPQGDATHQLFYRDLGLRRYDTAEDVLRALHAGEVEAAMVDRISALAYLGECSGLQIVGEPMYDLNYVIPVRLDSFRLLREINQVLLEMREDGTLESLQERWF
jgi:ABC-type amino acid transport substrate-binding protein